MEPNVDRQNTSDERTSDTLASEPRSTEPVTEYRGAGIMWSGVAMVVLIALLLIVAFQNTQDVEFQFLWFDTSIPLILILAIACGLALVAVRPSDSSGVIGVASSAANAMS